MSDRGLGELLGRRLAESGEAPKSISAAELHRKLLPYPVCRAELGLATKAEYDLALLHLLESGREVCIQDAEFDQAVKLELASPEPGLALMERFAGAEISLHPPDSPTVRARSAEAVADEPREGASVSTAATSASRGPPGAEYEAAAEFEAAADPGTPSGASPGGECWKCAASLPRRADLRYCPFCGVDQSMRSGPKCAAAVELKWKFCPVCGAETGFAGRANENA